MYRLPDVTSLCSFVVVTFNLNNEMDPFQIERIFFRNFEGFKVFFMAIFLIYSSFIVPF